VPALDDLCCFHDKLRAMIG
jgi:hypothetical protein